MQFRCCCCCCCSCFLQGGWGWPCFLMRTIVAERFTPTTTQLSNRASLLSRSTTPLLTTFTPLPQAVDSLSVFSLGALLALLFHSVAGSKRTRGDLSDTRDSSSRAQLHPHTLCSSALHHNDLQDWKLSLHTVFHWDLIPLLPFRRLPSLQGITRVSLNSLVSNLRRIAATFCSSQ